MTEYTAITPHIHRLVIPFLDIYTTVFVIKTPDGALLFDTATYPEDADNYILPALRDLGISQDALYGVVISHNHRDHAGSLSRIRQEFPDGRFQRNCALFGRAQQDRCRQISQRC